VLRHINNVITNIYNKKFKSFCFWGVGVGGVLFIFNNSRNISYAKPEMRGMISIYIGKVRG
jgi:hypothetical protein